MTQLKFDNDQDFLDAEFFKENEDGSITTKHGGWQGVLWEGFTRNIEVQTGTETVVVKEAVEEVLDEEGNVIVAAEPAETEEQPVFETQVYDSWAKLLELDADPNSPVSVTWLTNQEKDAVLVEQQRQLLKGQRDTTLNTMEHDFGDGRIVQTRPGDLINFQTAIEDGVSREWVLADNTIAVITVQEMIDAVASAKQKATQAYDDYINAVKALTGGS